MGRESRNPLRSYDKGGVDFNGVVDPNVLRYFRVIEKRGVRYIVADERGQITNKSHEGGEGYLHIFHSRVIAREFGSMENNPSRVRRKGEVQHEQT